jgi:hypothetical protein
MCEDGCSDGCWERQLWPTNRFVHLPACFFNVLTVLEWVLGASGFKLGSDWAPWLQIDVSGVTFGASRPDFG